jgi:hypothetical protein
LKIPAASVHACNVFGGASVDACKSLFVFFEIVSNPIKNIIKKPLSPNGERGLGREVKLCE